MRPDFDRNTTGWIANEQKLICMIVLDDVVGQIMSRGTGGEAFFRAFVTEDRKTGAIEAKLRFRYKDRDSWYSLNPKSDGKSRIELIAGIQEGIESVIRKAVSMFSDNVEVPKDALHSYFPPDDEGDGFKTIRWLEEQDLVNVTEVKIEEKR